MSDVVVFDETLTLRDGDTREITVELAPDQAVEPEAKRHGAPRRRRFVPGICPLVSGVFDQGTLGVKQPYLDVDYDTYIEDQFEGPVTPTYTDLYRNTEILMGLGSRQIVLESGEELPSCYPLQTDADTARSNTTIILDGERGGSSVALAEESERWRGPASVAAQRATIARLKASPDWIPQAENRGFEEWERTLDARERRRWYPEIASRVERDGEMVLEAAPGTKQLQVASEWQYEPWIYGDEARYMVTRGTSAYDVEISPDALRLNRSHALDVDLYLCPQLLQYRFDWLTEYFISVGWWGFSVYWPQVRTLTMRAAQFPRTFLPIGIPTIPNPVGFSESVRIGKTARFAEAVLNDVQLSLYNPTFNFIQRLQGRYGIYQLPHPAGALCGELDFRWKGGAERVRVFRRPDVELERPLLLLEANGLYVPGIVYPWSRNIRIEGPGAAANPSSIADGY